MPDKNKEQKSIVEILATPNPQRLPSEVYEGKELLDRINASESIDEIDKVIRLVPPQFSSHQLAITKRAQLHFDALKKPHWTVVPNFWLTAIAAIAAIIAGIIAWFAWHCPVSPPTPSDQVSPVSSSPSPPQVPADQKPE